MQVCTIQLELLVFIQIVDGFKMVVHGIQLELAHIWEPTDTSRKVFIRPFHSMDIRVNHSMIWKMVNVVVLVFVWAVNQEIMKRKCFLINYELSII